MPLPHRVIKDGPDCSQPLVKEVTISEYKERKSETDPVEKIHVERWHCPSCGYWKDVVIQEKDITGARSDFTKNHPYEILSRNQQTAPVIPEESDN